jgi:hypothetical protein
MPTSLALGPASVYWTNSATGSYGSVVEVSKEGGEAHTLAASRELPANIVVDVKDAYWAESSERLVSMALTGGDVVTLATGPIDALAEDDDLVYCMLIRLLDNAPPVRRLSV